MSEERRPTGFEVVLMEAEFSELSLSLVTRPVDPFDLPVACCIDSDAMAETVSDSTRSLINKDEAEAASTAEQVANETYRLMQGQ